MSFSTLIFIAGAVVTSLIPPLILEKMVDELTIGSMPAVRSIVLYMFFIALAGIMESGQNVVIIALGQKITHGVRSAMCKKLTRMKTEYFVDNEAGKTASYFVNDVDAVDSLFTNGIVSMFADACKVVSIIAIIFVKSVGLGIIIVILTPVLMIMTRQFQKRMLAAQIKNRIAIAKVNNHVPETIKNIRTIKNLALERYMEQKYDKYIEESYKATDKSNLYDSIYSPIIIFISSFVVAILMVFSSFGGIFSSFFGITVGSAVAIISYVGKVFDPLESIGMEIQNIQSAIAGIERINEYMRSAEDEYRVNNNIKRDIHSDMHNDECSNNANSNIISITSINPNSSITNDNNNPNSSITNDSNNPDSRFANNSNNIIEFRNVSFSYDGNNNVLSNYSLSIEKGERVVLSGRTGAGKSTIFRLIMGLYEPQKGQILIKDKEAHTISEDKRRKIFGYVEQQFHPVTGSIKDQITLHDDSYTMEEIIDAAKIAGIHDVIMLLKDGYDTLYEKAELSQGQMQLLQVARAVVSDPEIMLLDEMTANLDSNTEKNILNALLNASKGRTVISISHRLMEESMAHSLYTLE
ncbi:ABC transporter ATP-binding protein/permease [Falcatimonas sp. MSJ-15]|nr:ABC transporter ATP-binding protein [Falcatimonas sp. MSJ-15]MBU5470371.1 ABC transporter ATP-binding protein/permease [Falcatimonas sp. MSJ-15]